jgi:hypothetical protein
VATSLSGLAHVHAGLSRPVEGVPLLTRAVAVLEKALGPGHSDVATTLFHLAGVEQKSGKTQAAEAHHTRATAILGKVFGVAEAWPPKSQFEECRWEALRGHPEEALRGLTRWVGQGHADPRFATDSAFAALRGDPRFEAIVAQARRKGQAARTAGLP